MRKSSTDPKVKKTMVRNYEQKINNQCKLSYNVIAGCSKEYAEKSLKTKKIDQKNNLDQPTACSSEVLATYLSKAKKNLPSPLSYVDEPSDSSQLGAKITKKLNFHFNDRIYKNLVELNANASNVRNKRDKRVTKSVPSIKRDVEPNIEDFCSPEIEEDLCPDVPVIKPKLKRNIDYEYNDLHKLVASFEKL